MEDDAANECEVRQIREHMANGSPLLNGNGCNHERSRAPIVRIPPGHVCGPECERGAGIKLCAVCGQEYTVHWHGIPCAGHQRSFRHISALREKERTGA